MCNNFLVESNMLLFLYVFQICLITRIPTSSIKELAAAYGKTNKMNKIMLKWQSLLSYVRKLLFIRERTRGNERKIYLCENKCLQLTIKMLLHARCSHILITIIGIVASVDIFRVIAYSLLSSKTFLVVITIN